MRKPASQITANPPAAISIAVPKSGWEATRKTGISNARRGRNKCLIFETCSSGILL